MVIAFDGVLRRFAFPADRSCSAQHCYRYFCKCLDEERLFVYFVRLIGWRGAIGCKCELTVVGGLQLLSRFLPLLLFILFVFRLLLLALASQLVGFGFLSQLMPSFPIQRQFFPIIHIRFLHIVASYSWFFCLLASRYSSYRPCGAHAVCVRAA
jgi:hypothetical protein